MLGKARNLNIVTFPLIDTFLHIYMLKCSDIVCNVVSKLSLVISWTLLLIVTPCVVMDPVIHSNAIFWYNINKSFNTLC